MKGAASMSKLNPIFKRRSQRSWCRYQDAGLAPDSLRARSGLGGQQKMEGKRGKHSNHSNHKANLKNLGVCSEFVGR